MDENVPVPANDAPPTPPADAAPARDLQAEHDALKKQYASVQRELEKARRRSQDQSAQQAKLDAVVEELREVRSLIASGDFVDAETRERLQQTDAKRAQEAQFAEQATKRARRIQSALDGTDLDWESAPELAAARDAWEKGVVKGRDLDALDEAVVAAVAAASAKRTAPKATAAPAPAEQKPPTPDAPPPASRSFRVDTGDSAVPKPSPITSDTLRNMSPEERIARWDEIKKAVWGA